MDVCDICFDPPRPLETVATGSVLLDARDGPRRLLGEIAFRAPVCLHCVEVSVSRRVWTAEGWLLCAVTVLNRSSLPLGRVTVDPGTAAFSDGTIRVNGVSAGPNGAELDGLGPGCAAVFTWEVRSEAQCQGTPPPAVAQYEYRYGGRALTGRAESQ